MTAPLYNVDILRLAASLGEQSRLDAPDATVERRSPTCGSRVIVDVTTDGEGIVTGFGQEVRACALGQASAALLGNNIVGKDADDIARASAALGDFLTGNREVPGDWPGLALLARARGYPARHASIRLAFEAAAEAARQASQR